MPLPKKHPPSVPSPSAGTFASGQPVKISAGHDLVAFANAGFTATLIGTYRNGKTINYPAFLGIGYPLRFPDAVFQSVAPSAPDVNISWFEVPSDHRPFETPGKTGNSVIETSVALPHGTGAIIYTVPAGFKLRLLTMIVTGTAADTLNIDIQRHGNSAFIDNITAVAGLAIPAGGEVWIGCGPGNTIVLTTDIWLLAGDKLFGYTAANDGAADMVGLLEPL